MATEAYPKPGNQKRVRPVQKTSEFGDSDEFSERVRREAIKWRLINPQGDGNSYYVESDNFEFMVVLGVVIRQANMRVLIQAISKEGRFVPIPDKRWGEFSKQFREKAKYVSVPKQAAGVPQGSVPPGVDDERAKRSKAASERVRPIAKDRALVAPVAERTIAVPDLDAANDNPTKAKRRKASAKPSRKAVKVKRATKPRAAKKRKSAPRKKR